MSTRTRAYLALVFISIVWGTTYLAIKVGVTYYPPFLFAGVRQVLSGLILVTIALLVNRNKDVTTGNILRQMLVGFLMLTVGNGCVTWGEKAIPSGIAALICSLMPIFAVLFNVLLSGKDKFNFTIALGMILGVCGVGIIFRDSIKDIGNIAYIYGVLAVLLATSSWAMGSMVNKKNVNPVNPFFNSGLQLLFGGLFMLVISPFADDLTHVVLWNTEGIIALVYLIIFGSVLAYTAYMYSLAHLPVGIATAYAYVNPLVAVLLGALILKEPLTFYTILAFATITASVVLVNRGYKQTKQIK